MQEAENVVTGNKGQSRDIQANGSLTGSAAISTLARKQFIVSANPKFHEIVKL
jgi:hypothetical protein